MNHPIIERIMQKFSWRRQYPARDHSPIFDERDAKILRERIAKRKQISTPLQGDWIVLTTSDGAEDWRRVAHVWRHYDQANNYAVIGIDGIQPSSGGASVHLNEDGCGSYSGSLDDMIKWENIEDTGTRKAAQFWFFHRGMSGANRGVVCWVPVKVWRVKEFVR